MQILDIITKKSESRALSADEIAFFVGEYTRGTIPNYQASALLMAIHLNGMNMNETLALTLEMAKSDEILDLSGINQPIIDSSSTGGVGDKTTLIVAPLVASFGVSVPKMSGVSMGHTASTIDKLASIPGFKTNLSESEFVQTVRQTGVSIAGQIGNFSPASKKIDTLRNATATIASLPLITASILSRKIALGITSTVIDVKVGGGAIVKSLDQARELASQLVKIGSKSNCNAVALISNMDVPLGYSVGNTLEVIEAVETLRGNGSKDLTSLCAEIAANMLYLAKSGDLLAWRKHAMQALKQGKAFAKLLEFVAAQGGDVSYLTQTVKFPQAEHCLEVKSGKSGFISAMDTGVIGRVAMVLNAVQQNKEIPIDYNAGIKLIHKTGAYVQIGDVIARLYSSDFNKLEPARKLLASAIKFSDVEPAPSTLVFERVAYTPIN